MTPEAEPSQEGATASQRDDHIIQSMIFFAIRVVLTLAVIVSFPITFFVALSMRENVRIFFPLMRIRDLYEVFVGESSLDQVPSAATGIST